MAFLETRLDAKITRGARGGPVTDRIMTRLPNGKLFQDFRRSRGLHTFDVSHGIRSRADYELVRAAFYVVMFTPYEGLRFKDWNDFQATQTNSMLTLITGSTYQLQRVYSFGGIQHLRDIQKPVTGTAVVYRTRSAVVTTASASIDYTTGIATISGHVGGDTYTWAGEFDVPVTFTGNEWMASYEVATQNLHIQGDPITLEEISL